MKWIGWLNRNPQHATSEKPTTTTATVTVRPKTKHTSGWGCILMTTSHSSRCWNTWYNVYIYIWQRPDMSMKLVGCLNHSNLTHATSVELNPHTLLLPPPPLWLWDPAYHVEVASLWPLAAVEGAETHYIIYMYEVDLILVLSGWGASTITYNMIQVRNQDNLLLPFWLWDKAHIRLELHSYVAGAETLYMYEVDMSMKWMVVSQS